MTEQDPTKVANGFMQVLEAKTGKQIGFGSGHKFPREFVERLRALTPVGGNKALDELEKMVCVNRRSITLKDFKQRVAAIRADYSPVSQRG